MHELLQQEQQPGENAENYVRTMQELENLPVSYPSKFDGLCYAIIRQCFFCAILSSSS